MCDTGCVDLQTYTTRSQYELNQQISLMFTAYFKAIVAAGKSVIIGSILWSNRQREVNERQAIKSPEQLNL